MVAGVPLFCNEAAQGSNSDGVSEGQSLLRIHRAIGHEDLFMRDLIFVSLEDWDEVWRRNQFLCSEWLERFPGMRILFVGRSRDYSHAIRTGDWRGIWQPGLQSVPEFPGLSVLRPSKWAPNSLSFCRPWNRFFFAAQVRSAARSLGLRQPILWINDHFAWNLAGQLGERALVYDVTDDWTQMPSIRPAERKRIEAADRELCRRADLVLVCSRALEASRVSRCRRLERVANGVDASHYVSVAKQPCREAGEAAVFGYLGTLHPDRLDIALVEALARRFPKGRVILCGPDYLGAEARSRLHGVPNVEVRPPVPYREVTSVLSEFDVCVVPHLCNAFTESLNPIKLWEYFACGKPVASTPVAGFSDYPDLVHLGGGESGFLQACQDALMEGGRLAARRIQEASEHSWTARVMQITEIFRQEGWLAGGAWCQRGLGSPSRLLEVGSSVGAEVCHG
ncbi:MAG: putative teichuronic acid biosynthesis glycosyltransferase TuaH [Verrucomicrobiota bacterium]